MIRVALMFALMTCASVAHAQDVGQPGWMTVDAASTRFPGEKLVGQTFTAGTQVTVVVKDGDLLRVSNGDKFGWVPAASVTATAPEGAVPQAPIQVNLGPAGAVPQ